MENPFLENQQAILLIGGSGFIGQALGEFLSDIGYTIRLLTRQSNIESRLSYPCTIYQWDGFSIPHEAIDSAYAVVNLAGESVADQRWSKIYKHQILESRIQSTRALFSAISKAERKPKVVIQTSAVGYYGQQSHNEPCDEQVASGNDFLSQVCKQWEEEARAIENYSRLCVMRLGVVLSWTGGALPKLWDVYSSGIGGVLGNGEQWINWIHISDVVNFVKEAIQNVKFQGVFNLVAPENITNKQFHKIICKITPSFENLTIPSFIIKLSLGERSTLVINGPKVQSKALVDLGFIFSCRDFYSCLKSLLSERLYPNASYFNVKQWVPGSLNTVWDYMSLPDNLEEITPHWLAFKIVKSSTPQVVENTNIDYKLKIHGLPVKWQVKIKNWQPKVSFKVEQEKGPFRLWIHSHFFKAHAGGVLIENRIEYQLPCFPLGQIGLKFIQSALRKIFNFRKRKLTEIFAKKS